MRGIIIRILRIIYINIISPITKQDIKNLTRSYNIGYQEGYKRSMEHAMESAEETSQEVVNKFSAQFKGMLEGPPYGMDTINVIEGSEIVFNNVETTIFRADSYVVSFTVHPNPKGYATWNTIEDKLKENI